VPTRAGAFFLSIPPAKELATRSLAGHDETMSKRSGDALIQLAGGKPVPDIRGFTLLEMLVAASVVLVLTALLLSLVQLHVIRHQVASTERSLAGIQEKLLDFHDQLAQWPSRRTDVRLDADPASSRTSYTQAVEISGPAIVVTFGRRAHPRIAGMQLKLEAMSNDDGSWHWRCREANAATSPGQSAGPQRFAAVEAMTLPPRYHPKACRNARSAS